MALKDLVISKAVLSEQAIEKIVAPYVHYDCENKQISLSHEGARLPAKKRVLIYLVALQGWPYVAEETIPTDASPTDLEDQIGSPGGTVRPMLMDLTDRHLVNRNNGRYSVRASNLHAITQELEGKSSARTARASPRKAKAKTGNGKSNNRRPKLGKRRSQVAVFDRWIDEGYFDTPRTQADVVKKFRQVGMMVSSTSVPQLFLKAIRSERLLREEREVSGRNVWVYYRPK